MLENKDLATFLPIHFRCTLTFSSFDVVELLGANVNENLVGSCKFRCCREVTNASAKMAFYGLIEQCPLLVSHPFLNVISFSRLFKMDKLRS